MLGLAKVILWIAFFVVAWLLDTTLFMMAMLAFFVYLIYKAVPTVLSVRANMHFSRGEYRKACELYKKANKRENVKFNTKYYYACTLMRCGDFEKAESMLNEIIRDRKNVKEDERNVARQQRCMVYLRQGRKDEATEDAMELFNGGYKNSQMYAMIGYFKTLGDEPQSEVTAFCEEAYEYNSDHRDIMDNLSICYYREGRLKEAMEISDKLMSLNPTFVEAYYHGAQIALRCNDYDKARELAKGIDKCHRSAMTTITKEEINDLKRQLGLTGQE